MTRTEALKQSLPIHLLRSTDEHGCACHFIIRATPSNLSKLNAAQGKFIDIRDYAEILFSGFGADPLPSTRATIHAQFGVELPE